MKAEDTEVLGRQRAKPSMIKAQYSRPTCKNCSYLCAPLFFSIFPFQSRPTSHLRCGQVEVRGSYGGAGIINACQSTSFTAIV